MDRRRHPAVGGFVTTGSGLGCRLTAFSGTRLRRLVAGDAAGGGERVEDTGVRALLGRMCDLHALSRLDVDRAWYVEHGFLTASRSRSLTPAVNALCGELRPHARLLVDGFGIPEGWLACPLLGTEHSGTASGSPATLAAIGRRSHAVVQRPCWLHHAHRPPQGACP